MSRSDAQKQLQPVFKIQRAIQPRGLGNDNILFSTFRVILLCMWYEIQKFFHFLEKYR